MNRLDLLGKDDWSQFTVGMFSPRKVPQQFRRARKFTDPETLKYNRAMKLVRVGEFSRAYALLMSTASIAPVDLAVLDNNNNILIYK